jgi:tetratricopeptide (TPR) repeat protein
MSQSLRRALVWITVVVLLLVGTLLAVRAAPGTARPEEKESTQEALTQAFGCMVSLLTLHLPQAEESCGKTIDLFPDVPLGYKFRGFAYLLEHRFERAEADFREAVRLDPRDPDSQAGLGQSLSGQGRFDEAVESFGIALAMQPHDVRYLAARCWARAGQGKNFKAALADCNLAIKFAPKSAVAFDARGLVHLKKGQNSQAVYDFSKSLSLNRGEPTALFGRGIAEWHLGDMASARNDLALARQADSDIDDTYALVGVLERDCQSDGPTCSLPKALRPSPRQQPPGSYLSVRYRP